MSLVLPHDHDTLYKVWMTYLNENLGRTSVLKIVNWKFCKVH